MRKILSLATMAMVMAVGFGAPRAEAADVTVTVTIKNIAVSLTGLSTVAFGFLDVNVIEQTDETTDIEVTNNGNVNETFTLLLVNPSGWTAAAAPGTDIYVLSGLFVADADAPDAGTFDADDVITDSVQTATTAIFGDGDGDGVGVEPNNKADLWLELKTPLVNSVFTQQSITVTVGAVAS